MFAVVSILSDFGTASLNLNLSTWLCLLILFLSIYYFTWSRSRMARLVNELPGPAYLPLIGNVFDFLKIDYTGNILLLGL